MAALSTIHDVTGRRLVNSIYSCDIYGMNEVNILFRYDKSFTDMLASGNIPVTV
jgi:hypothetical protein